MEELQKLHLLINQDPLLNKGLTAVFWIFIIFTLTGYLRKLAGRVIVSKGTRDSTRRALKMVSRVLAVITIFMIFSDRMKGIGVAFGVAGAGIAFALQEVIASIAGWLANLAGNFYRVGDRIQLGGIKGDVIDIGVLRTTVMELGQWVEAEQYNGRIVRIANSYIFKEPVFNYSADFPFLWDEIKVPIKYGSDRTMARNLILEACDEVVGVYCEKSEKIWQQLNIKYSVENASTRPTVFLIANDNWLEFTARYVVEFNQRRSTKDKIFESLMKRVDQSNGKVAMASMTVQIVETPQFKVQIDRA